MTLTVEDRLDILDIFARYCRYADHDLGAEWVDLFLPEGCFEIVGQMKLVGAPQLAEMPAMLARQSGGKWRHQITDVVIDAVAGSGDVRGAGSGLLTDWNNGGKAIMFADYQGVFRKTGGTWRIVSLTASMLMA